MSGSINGTLCEGNTYLLRLSGEISSDCFFKGNGNSIYWGKIQNDFIRMSENTLIIVDISEVIWMDILGILYLLLDLKKVSKKCKVEFIPLDANDNLEMARFHAYLVQIGYFEIITEISNQEREELISQSQIDKYRKAIDESSFDFCPTVFPITLVQNADEVSEVIDKIYMALRRQDGAYNSSDINRISSFLELIIQECVDNVFEHAYDEDGFCLVFLRELHYGSIVDSNVSRYNKSKTVNEKIKIVNSLEENRIRQDRPFSKYVHQCFAENKTYSNQDEDIEHRDIIQIFVADVGKGIAKSFGLHEKGDDRSLVDGILSEGKRSKAKTENTTGGGLSMINHLLEDDNDLISVKGEYSWVRHICSLDKASDSPNFSYITNKGKYEPFSSCGTAFIFEIKKKETNLQTIFQSLNLKGELPQAIYSRAFREKYSNLIQSSYDGEKIECCDCRYTDSESIPPKTIHGEKVLLVRRNIRKNDVIQKINAIFEPNTQTLIIGEIPDSEWKKYNFVIERLSVTNYEKIIIITESLKSGVYKKSKYSGYYYNEIETEAYVKREDYYSLIGSSVISYALWLKWYDSREIWKLIKSNDFYAGGKIEWNEELIIDGYMDFFQMNLSQFAKKMLVRQMRRIMAFEGYVRFEPIDRLTQDLCNEANRSIPTYGHINKIIGIGSVFVTGDTLEELGCDEYIYFFKHDSAKIDVLSLLDWHEKFDEIASKDAQYHRVGNLPFIAQEGDDYFRRLHYANHQINYCISPGVLYDMIQSYALKRNSLSCFGHIDMIDRHDMVHIDYADIFRGERNWHYSVKYSNVNDNIWDYVLCEIACSIMKKIDENIFDAGTQTLNNKFNEKVKQYVDAGKAKPLGGILIYASDYQTREIVESVKNTLKKQYADRIVAIAPLIRNRPSSSFMISPLYLEKIEKSIREYSEVGVPVTICVAEGISTRQQMELEHIMYVLGASAVHFISIVDRTRMPLGVDIGEKRKAFCRIDLPTARNNNACILCKGKSVVERYIPILVSHKLNSLARNLINRFGNEGQTEWNCSQGIHAQRITIPIEIIQQIGKICKAYGIEKIEINTDIGLVLFSIEAMVISMSPVFLQDCIKNSSLGINVKILLICAQLFHFTENELTKTLQEESINDLFRLCLCKSRRNENDVYLELGILVLLSMIDKKKQVYEKLLAETISQGIYTDDISLLMFLALIIIYDIVKGEKKSRELEGWLLNANEGTLDVMYGIVLHTQPDYDHTHSNTSYRIYKDSIVPNQRVEPLLLEIQYLKGKYDYIKERYIKNESEVEVIKKILSDEEELINQYQNERILPDEYNSSIKRLSSEMIVSAASINEKYFICKVKESIKLEKRLQEIADRVIDERHVGNQGPIKNIRIAVYPSDLGDKRMFYFNRDIETEIEYLMTDFRHASEYKMIDDSIRVGTVYCDGLVKVRFYEEYVDISFYNLIDGSSEMDHIRKQKINKICRPSHLIFEQINEIFRRAKKDIDNPRYGIENQGDKKIFVATIKLPYLEL